MSNNNTNEMSRRGLLKTAGAGVASTGLAGCASILDSNDENNGEESEETPTQTTTPEKETEEDIDQALKAMAYNLHDDLYTRGFDPGSYKLVDVRETGRDDADYRVRVDVDLDSIFSTAGMNVNGQDLHTATQLDMVDDIFQDVSPQLNELTGMIEENFEHLYSEVDSEVPVDLDIAISGARGSSYRFTTDMQEEELENRLRRFTKQPRGIGASSFKPMNYEDLTLMEEGETRSIGREDEAHTLEYIGDGRFRINGDPQEREERSMVGSFDGNRVYVSDIDPIYLQEEEEFDGAVELQFTGGMEPEY